ncbi:hypothetical protein ACFL96_19650, partial [Thermoproteota archaeon]
ESLKWEQDIPISYDEDTRPAILAAIKEGRFFAMDTIVDIHIATLFRGSPDEIAKRFYDHIIEPPSEALDAMARTLRSPPMYERLKSSFLFLQFVIRRLNDEQIARRRFVIILEPGFETTKVDPTIIYKGDFAQGKFASLLSHAGRNTSNIYIGLNTLEFVQASQYHIPGLIAIIRHENQNIYHGYHLTPAGRNKDLIFDLWRDLFVFVYYQNQILSNNPVRPENARAQLILREVISHLNRHELADELNRSATSFSENRKMRVVMRPAKGQEEQAKTLYQHGINDGVDAPDSGECVSFDGCELPSDSTRFAGDLVGILEGYKHEIDTPGFDSDEVSHNFVTDGGLKTRMFAFTIQRVFQGAYRMFSKIFLDISFLSQQTLLAQCPGMGKGYTLLGGSDNIVAPGALTSGGKPLADLPKDADLVFFGAGTRVPVPEDMNALKELNDGLEQERRRMLIDEGKKKNVVDHSLSVQTSDAGHTKLAQTIMDEKLCDLGLIAADSGGRLAGFKEKGNFNQVVDLAIAGSGFVVRNAFLLLMKNNVLKRIFDAFSVPAASDDSIPLREKYAFGLFATIGEGGFARRQDIEEANRFLAEVKTLQEELARGVDADREEEINTQIKSLKGKQSVLLPASWDSIDEACDRIQLWEIVQQLHSDYNFYVADLGIAEDESSLKREEGGFWFDVGNPRSYIATADFVAFNNSGRRYFGLPSLTYKIISSHFPADKVTFEDPDDVFMFNVTVEIGRGGSLHIGRHVKISNTNIIVPAKTNVYIGCEPGVTPDENSVTWATVDFAMNWYIEQAQITATRGRDLVLPIGIEVATAERRACSMLYGFIPKKEEDMDLVYGVEAGNANTLLVDRNHNELFVNWPLCADVKAMLPSAIPGTGSTFEEWRQGQLGITYLLEGLSTL